MAGTYKPLVIVAGKLQQIQSGNTLIGADSTVAGLFPSSNSLYGLAGLTGTAGFVAVNGAGGASSDRKSVV